ncbi:hypothetical protein [Desulfonatronovibrio magnus]|uniref:hypothetical protein n=1 Tax=Desulfonatronovibrio magnus TaxID=698827 RepID=UPI0005EBD4A1|nr:hypothetical protein [Desulfonatronovibrio magnus]
MAAIIYDPVQFSKKIDKLEKAGGKAAFVASEALEIIQDLANNAYMLPRLKRKLTKSGDARLANCCKFQLGSGYRLVITIKDGCFVILFLGTHDETDNWIKNNMGVSFDCSRGEVVPAVKVSRDESDKNVCDVIDYPPSIHDLDVPLDEVLDQKTLREIFCGITGTQQC